MTFGPIEPSMTGNSIDLPLALSVNVIVPAGAMTLVLLPSIDAPQCFARGRLPDLAQRIGCRMAIIKRRSDFAMQYRGCEKPTLTPPQRPHRRSVPGSRRGRAPP